MIWAVDSDNCSPVPLCEVSSDSYAMMPFGSYLASSSSLVDQT